MTTTPLSLERQALVSWLHWSVADRRANPGHWIYSENAATRSAWQKKPLFTWPLEIDCSMYDDWIGWAAGLVDCLGEHYDGLGYTGTELSFDQHIALLVENAQHVEVVNVQPGDLVVYGAGTGLHTATLVTAGHDPMTVSFGGPPGPAYVPVSQGNPQPGSPVTFLRRPVAVRPGAKLAFAPGYGPVVPPAPKPTPAPAKPSLIAGATGAAVEELQKLLNQHGAQLKVDGKFGPLTLAAVKHFQSTNSIPASGVVGSATWTALLKA